jgi:hypothetical protein
LVVIAAFHCIDSNQIHDRFRFQALFVCIVIEVYKYLLYIVIVVVVGSFDTGNYSNRVKCYFENARGIEKVGKIIIRKCRRNYYIYDYNTFDNTFKIKQLKVKIKI